MECMLILILSRVSLDHGISDRGGCVECMVIPVSSQDGQSISGSQDTLTEGGGGWYCPGMVRVSLNPGTEGGCVEYMFVPVLPWDGQSISGSWGSLTEGSCVECMFIPVLSRDGQMYFWHLRILCHSMASLDIP